MTISAGRAKSSGGLRPAMLALGVPGVVYALGGLLCWVFQHFEPFDPAGNNIGSLVSIGVALLFGAVWAIWFAPWWSRTTRRVFLYLSLVVIAVPVACFRLDGTQGDLMPRLAFRWTPKHDATLEQLGNIAAEKPIDLTATSASDFPQFLGPDRNGTLPNPGLARDWNAQPPRQLWRNEVGAGWCSFAVVGNYAVTLEQRDEQELTICYRLDNGQPTWSHAENVRFNEVVGLGGPGPRATPTIVAGKVVSLGGTGVLNCLDGATGKPVWRKDIIAEYGGDLPMYGMPSSPLVVDGHVIVGTAGGAGKALVALDLASGDEVWKAGDGIISYSSPMVATLAGTRQIVKVYLQSITGHDPADGHVLWDAPWPESGTEPTVSQPVPIDGNHLFVSKGYRIGCMLLSISHDGDRWSQTRKWQNLNMRTKFSSVVLHDGYVFGFNENLLTCLDPQTGQIKWKTRGERGGYGFGQLLLVGDLLLIQSETGFVALVEANPAGYRELTRFEVFDSKTWNTPVLTGSRLLLRNDRQAACFELPLAGAAATAEK